MVSERFFKRAAEPAVDLKKMPMIQTFAAQQPDKFKRKMRQKSSVEKVIIGLSGSIKLHDASLHLQRRSVGRSRVVGTSPVSAA